MSRLGASQTSSTRGGVLAAGTVAGSVPGSAVITPVSDITPAPTRIR